MTALFYKIYEYPNRKLSLIGIVFTIVFLSSLSPAFTQDIVINELMADNEASLQDPAGEYDDWLELYNNSDELIDLSGWYMSDDANELNEWVFPVGTSIDANGFLIVWCDEDLEQEGLHADFKLSANGESIYLCTPDLGIVQEITYSDAITDQSYSRVPNGTGDFVWQEHTFNGPNSTAAVSAPLKDVWGISYYPVPAREYLTIEHESNENLTLKIYSMTGKLIWAESIGSTYKINVQSWPKGMYILSNDSGVRSKIIIQ